MILILSALLTQPVYAVTLPDGFSFQTLLTGLNKPISLAFLPDGRMLVLQMEGTILIAQEPDYDSAAIYMTMPNVNSSRNSDTPNERGLLDIALDPDFHSNGFFYVYYSSQSPQYFRISRFRHLEKKGMLTSYGDIDSETVLWQDNEDYTNHFYHYGGGLDFGPDGKLYCTLGDKFRGYMDPFGGGRAQDTARYAGKVLRINKDGSIPDGTDGYAANPFINGPGLDAIWALGLRNPFKANWDLPSGKFFIAEVGSNGEYPTTWEDIHVCKADSSYAGVNYGWPNCEGLPPFSYFPNCKIAGTLGEPLFSYEHSPLEGCIIGGVVYRGNNFPSIPYFGAYFYGDFVLGALNYLTIDSRGNVLSNNNFAAGLNQLVAIEQGYDGFLYLIHHSGEVSRITYPLHLLTSYVILTKKETRLHHNLVFSGGIGCTDDYGKVKLDGGTQAIAPASFVCAKIIVVNDSSSAHPQFVTVPTLTMPLFEHNLCRSNKTLNIPDNSTISLYDSVFGFITIGRNCDVTFTQPVVNAESIYVKDWSSISFSAPQVKMRIRGKFQARDSHSFNANENGVTLYVEKDVSLGKGSTVNADIYLLSGKMTVATGDSTARNTMKGLFIAPFLEAGGYTYWNKNIKCGEICQPTTGGVGTSKMDENEQLMNKSSENEIMVKAYPNPFKDILTIEFSLPEDSDVKLDIFNVAGLKIATLFEGNVKASEVQKFDYSPSMSSDGMFIYRLQTSEGTFYGKAVMAK